MKGNTASMIALTVSGLVLLVVGGNSYNNYLRGQYEKEYGVLKKHQVEEAGDTGALTADLGYQEGANVVKSTLDPGASSLSGAMVSANSPTTTRPAPLNQSPPPFQAGNSPTNARATAPPSSGSTAGAGTDPEIARLQARLEALEQESALYQQKFNQVKNGNATSSTVPVAKPVESGSLREVLGQEGKGASPALFPKGGASSAEQMKAKSEFEKQILGAPAVGKVVEFNAKWGFVQIDAGKNHNVSQGARFAVRRGAMIVGYVKAEEVNENTTIAELTSRNEFSETALKPKLGDDIINWPLF